MKGQIIKALMDAHTVDFREGYMTQESAAETAKCVLRCIREAPLSICWEAAKMGADRDSDLVQRQFAHIIDKMLETDQ